MINKDTIKSIIEEELNMTPNIDNLHGIDQNNLNQYLISPVKRVLIDPVKGTRQEYWVVLDEEPDSNEDGYLIIYSEDQKSFGLATKRNTQYPNIGTCVSLYDTFIDALNAM